MSIPVRSPVAFTDGHVRRVSRPDAWMNATANTKLPSLFILDANGRIAYRSVGVGLPQASAVLDSLLMTGA